MTADTHGSELGARRGAAVRAFFDWWLGELAGMVPGALGRAARFEREILRFGPSDDRLRIEVQSGGRMKPVATVALDESGQPVPEGALEAALNWVEPGRYQIVLALDDAKALRRDLTLPGAAAPVLAEMLEFEIERHTPFRDDQVYFFYRTGEADGHEDALAVGLVVIPRRIVDPLVERLNALGLPPEAVTLSDPGLLPGPSARQLSAAATPRSRSPGARRLKTMAVFAAALAIAAAVSPLLRLSVTANQVAAEVARVASDAAATRSLQNEVDRLSLGFETVTRAQAAAPFLLGILDGLSKLLPDDTWLAQLGVVGERVTLEGRTASSAPLVGLIEASAIFGEVTYVSPITRDSGGNFERFNFSVRLRPR